MPSETDNAVVREGIIAFNEKLLGERDKTFSIFLKDPLGNVFGGIFGVRHAVMQFGIRCHACLTSNMKPNTKQGALSLQIFF